MPAFRLLMALAVLGCIAASATFAFEFGWTRGASDVHRWTYALAGVALDLLKSGLPIFGAMAWHDSRPARSLACWLVFAVLTGLSMWCAYGTTATQLAEKFANQAVASVAQTSRQTALDRLRKQRDSLAFTETSAETVKTAEDAVAAATAQADAERARGGCKDLCRQREKEEREARAALLKARTDRAATIKAADLDAKIAAAEAALDAVDVKAAVKEADPQSASMAKAIGADQNLIAALSHAVFAIAIELGSGVGFWLVFGHGPAPRREDPERPPAPSTALVPIDREGAQELQVIDERPEEIIERFFLEVVRPRLNRRVQSMAVWSAYKQWCADRDLDPVSHAMFGRLARWRKDRIGGVVYYLDCELAEGYDGADRRPRSRRRCLGPASWPRARRRHTDDCSRSAMAPPPAWDSKTREHIMLLEIAGVAVSAIGLLNDLVTRYQDLTQWGEADLVADDRWLKIAVADGILPAGEYSWSRPEKVAARELQGTHAVVIACNAEKRVRLRICRRDGTVLLRRLVTR